MSVIEKLPDRPLNKAEVRELSSSDRFEDFEAHTDIQVDGWDEIRFKRDGQWSGYHYTPDEGWQSGSHL